MFSRFPKVLSIVRRLFAGDLPANQIAEKIKLRGYRYYRNKRAGLELLLFSNRTNRFHQSVKTFRTVQAIRESSAREHHYYFTNVESGVYELEISIASNPVSSGEVTLLLYISLSGCKVDSEIATSLKAEVDESGRACICLSRDLTTSCEAKLQRLIPVNGNHRWIKFTVPLHDQAQPKLETISFMNTGGDGLDALALGAVPSFVQQHPRVSEAEFIVYADINLNVVDGSSIWLTSITNILCNLGKTILLCKQDMVADVTVSNIEDRYGNLLIIQPSEIFLGLSSIDCRTANAILRVLDSEIPSIRNIVLRGVDAAFLATCTRQYSERLLVYLTDFYNYDMDGMIRYDNIQSGKTKQILLHAHKVLVQTSSIRDVLQRLISRSLNFVDLPPVVPSFDSPPDFAIPSQVNEIIKLGYAGKITPDWGVVEMLEWTNAAEQKLGVKIELHIVSNKITENGIAGIVLGFSEKVQQMIESSGGRLYSDFNRKKSINKMQQMDFVWCWRPSLLEENTLEVSTKLIEMIAYGKPCICFPNSVNRNLIGEDYPYFAESVADFLQILQGPRELNPSISESFHSRFGLATRVDQFRSSVVNSGLSSSQKNIVVAGHDFKFIDSFISHLKSRGYRVVRDLWRWGEPENISNSKRKLAWADLVLCEWGLENAVWYSQNIRPQQELFVRVHLQEINDRAKRFGFAIKIENVTKVIFVSENVRKTAIQIFGWPAEKTMVIPNYTLTDEYRLVDRSRKSSIDLGIVGIIPQRKRLDRAVDLVELLQLRGYQVSLSVKGPRPESIAFMHAPSRRAELDFYDQIYARIQASPELEKAISFQPWGNNVALWYEKVDFILSCSDFESFHYALADGVLSGCLPLLWPWEEASDIYAPDWVCNDTAEAAERVIAFQQSTSRDLAHVREENRKLIAEKYGANRIYSCLIECMKLT